MSKIDFKENVAVLISFIILTIVFFYPHIVNWQETTFGEFDVYWFLWSIWHTEQRIDEGQNPFFTDITFAPYGADLSLTLGSYPLTLLLSYPLVKVFGLFGAYNILILSSFVLSGYFAYLLIFYLTKDSYGSFIGATIFSFSSQHLVQAIRHLNLVHIEFIPLFWFYLLKAFDKGQKKDWCISGIILGLSIYVDVRLSLMTLISTVFLVFFLKPFKELRKTKMLVYFFIIAGVIALPQIIISVNGMFLGSNRAFSSFGFVLYYSPDLFNFFVPPPQSLFLGGYTAQIYKTLAFRDFDTTIYLGVVALFLSLLAIIKVKSVEYIKQTGLWIATLSLGPLLKIFGGLVPMFLPFSIFVFLPILNILRVPSRFNLIFMLIIGILSSFGFVKLTEKKKKLDKILIFGIVLFLIIIENYAILPQIDQTSSLFYKNLEKEEKQTLIYVPFSLDVVDEGLAKRTYLQIEHKNKINIGVLSVVPNKVYGYYMSGCNRELYTLNFSECEKKDFVFPDDAKYLIFTKNNYETYEFNTHEANATLTEKFGSNIYEDDELSVFCIQECSNYK